MRISLSAFLLCPLFVGGLLLSGCSSQTAQKPEEMTIQMSSDEIITLTDSHLVQSLYETLFALSSPSSGGTCTSNLRIPIYQLTFYEASKIILTAIATRGSSSECGVVSLPGEQQGRETSSAFWKMLDSAIPQAFASFHAQKLVIGYFPSEDAPGRLALLSSLTTMQKLYNVLENLPMASQTIYSTAPKQCRDKTASEYRLLFTSPPARLLFFFSSLCTFLTLGDSGSGVYNQRDEQFRQLFAEVLKQNLFTQVGSPTWPEQGGA